MDAKTVAVPLRSYIMRGGSLCSDLKAPCSPGLLHASTASSLHFISVPAKGPAVLHSFQLCSRQSSSEWARSQSAPSWLDVLEAPPETVKPSSLLRIVVPLSPRRAKTPPRRPTCAVSRA